MKTPEQIRERLELLKARVDTPQKRQAAAAVALMHAQDALAWVLDEHDEDSIWPLQRSIDVEEARR